MCSHLTRVLRSQSIKLLPSWCSQVARLCGATASTLLSSKGSATILLPIGGVQRLAAAKRSLRTSLPHIWICQPRSDRMCVEQARRDASPGVHRRVFGYTWRNRCSTDVRNRRCDVGCCGPIDPLRFALSTARWRCSEVRTCVLGGGRRAARAHRQCRAPRLGVLQYFPALRPAEKQRRRWLSMLCAPAHMFLRMNSHCETLAALALPDVMVVAGKRRP